MIAPQLCTSRLSNRYGEEWVFEHDPTKGRGVLRGSDVEWQEYRVIDRRVPGPILNDEEILWLREAWASATSGLQAGLLPGVLRPHPVAIMEVLLPVGGMRTMRYSLATVATLIAGFGGGVVGWMAGVAMDRFRWLSLGPEEFWRTDPENV